MAVMLTPQSIDAALVATTESTCAGAFDPGIRLIVRSFDLA